MHRTLLVAALAGLVACGGNDPINPAYQPQIVNDAVNGKFEFQLTGVQNGTGLLTYSWLNPSATASIDRSSSISSGTVLLRIKDAASPPNVVYAGPLEGASGSVSSATGAAGSWTIDVDFAGATGTINFRVQKGP